MLLTSIVGLFQLALFSMLLIILLLRRDQCRRWFGLITSILNRISTRRTLALRLVCGVSLLTSITLSLLIELPAPVVHDEFSYLLAADTFSKGRLTNPTHPMWQHFETFHVIHQPTYASKFPIGQGVFLAIGQILTGYPIAGVWLSTALAVMALSWMLRGWVPGRWALIGGLIAAFHPVVLAWSQNYWGGSVAMGGGALALGAYQRIKRRPLARRVWLNAFWLGLGMAILANSRPYEGMVLSLIVGGLLVIDIVKGKIKGERITLRKILLPISLVLAITMGWIIIYNTGVTGKWWQMPYIVHEYTYMVAPLFIWQDARPEPFYRNEVIKKFHTKWEPSINLNRDLTMLNFADSCLRKIFKLSNSYLRMLVILVPLLFSPLVLMKDSKIREAAVMGGLFIAGLFLESYDVNLHYAAPAMGLLLIVVVQSMRHLQFFTWRGVHFGRVVMCALAFCCLTLPIIAYLNTRMIAKKSLPSKHQRVRIIEELEKTAGHHLVLVRYGAAHDVHEEWVYNKADIDGSKIVWARELDENSNRRLMEYYKDRCIWLLKLDTFEVGTAELSPLSNCVTPQTTQ